MRLTKVEPCDIDVRHFIAARGWRDALIYVKADNALYQVIEPPSTNRCIVMPMIACKVTGCLPHFPMQRFLQTQPTIDIGKVLLTVADDPRCQIFAFCGHTEAMKFVNKTITEFLGG